MLLFCDSFDHYTTVTQKGWSGTGGYGISGSGRYGNAGYAQGSYVGGYSGTLTRSITATAELIFGAALYTTNRTQWSWHLIETGTVHIALTINASGNIEVRLGSGGTLLGTGTAVISDNTWTYIELRAKIHDSTGTINVQVNGASDIALTGQDTRNGGTSGVINSFSHRHAQPGIGGGTQTSYIDDFVIMDTTGSLNNAFHGDIRVECLFPNGNGYSSQLDGSDGNTTDNYLLVDETTPNSDTDYVESPDIGDQDTYTFSDLVSTVGTVYGVQVCPFAKKSDAGTRTIASVSRYSAAEEVGTAKTLTTSYLYYPQVFEDDPGTAAWTIASVNAAEFGVEITG